MAPFKLNEEWSFQSNSDKDRRREFSFVCFRMRCLSLAKCSTFDNQIYDDADDDGGAGGGIGGGGGDDCVLFEWFLTIANVANSQFGHPPSDQSAIAFKRTLPGLACEKH